MLTIALCVIHGPPSSTLFPYTTLFRSVGGRATAVRPPDGGVRRLPGAHRRAARAAGGLPGADRPARQHARSEEHTSELQSLAYLVCRLLLEKKKTNITGGAPSYIHAHN